VGIFSKKAEQNDNKLNIASMYLAVILNIHKHRNIYIEYGNCKYSFQR